MNIVSDNQWPSFFIKTNQKYQIKFEKKIDLNLIKKIEDFFQKHYGFKIILYPSARAGIGSILRYSKIDRSKEVFVNKWISYCIFNTLGKYTNISTNFNDPDLALAVHKWGFKQIIPKKKNMKIIEDSVDSIIINKNELFENNGDFEIISLPKIIGSISGGIIITKDTNFYEYAKKEQIKNKALGQYQARRKFEEINKKNTFHSYFHHESTNTFLEYNSLINISKSLKNYQINKNTILKRQKYFKKKFHELKLNFDRLGPVIPINFNSIKNHNLMNKYFLLRHIHKNKYKVDVFKKVYLIPIHFKITEKKFYFYLNILKKCIHKIER